ncbi:hypothetical protein K525DRAFT_271352 [Schizophyllum commune Loenen D]|nr:hypothetical protein K525DRAFT_271352 [Schizophyllum commune Loenen D]
MSAPISDISLSYLIRRYRLLDPSSGEAATVAAEIEKTLRSPRLFDHLRAVSPTLPSGSRLNFDSRSVTLVLRNIHTLQDALRLPTDFSEAVACSVRRIWHHLIPWLDYLHPMHHVGTERLKDIPVDTMCEIFRRLLRMKPILLDLFVQTPLVYGLLFVLWLRVGDYTSSPSARKSVFSCADLLDEAVLKHASWQSGVSPAVVDYKLVDQSALEGARWATRDHTRKIYTRLISHCRMILEEIPQGATPTARMDLLGSLRNKLNSIQLFTEPLAPVSTMPREVMVSLVDLLRAMRSLAAEAAGSPASENAMADEIRSVADGICFTFTSIWKNSEDRRALVWSLRAGVLPLIIALHREQKTLRVTEVLRVIATETVYAEVAREQPEIASEELLESAATAVVRERLELARVSYQKACSYSRCRTTTGSARESIRRCPCLSVYYCSTDCQRLDWPTHRADHKSDTFGVPWMWHGPMSPMSAHFLRLCGKEYMRTHLGAVLDSITELSRTLSSPAWTIHIIIQFSALVPSHTVHATPLDANAQRYKVLRQAQEAGDPEVLVTARVGLSYRAKSAVLVDRATLKHLQLKDGRIFQACNVQ